MTIRKILQYKIVISKLIAATFRFILKKNYIDNLWVIGGYGGNEIAIFRYLQDKHPEIKVYLITNDKVLYKSTKTILKRGSTKAYICTQLAQVVMCTHSLSHNFDLTAKELKHSLKVQMFHGMIGLNLYPNMFYKEKPALESMGDYDLIIASSEQEKTIKSSWGIDPDKIVITGLPRHDMLLRKQQEYEQSNTYPINILYMPTWRPWLKLRIRENIRNRIFSYKNIEFESYLGAIKELLIHPKLVDLIKQGMINVNLFLHINMQIYYRNVREALSKENISTLPQGINLQDEIVKHDLLITDYSSVSWEFLLLGKPVIFYQFDLHEYISRVDSLYIDMQSSLFGPKIYSTNDTVNAIENLIMDRRVNYKIDTISNNIKRQFFAYNDEYNSERVVDNILRKLKRFTKSFLIN